MKAENGHATTESLPWEALSTQVAGAVGELLRAQQQLEVRCRDAENREAEIVQRERALEAASAELAAKAAGLADTEARLTELGAALEQREQHVAELEAYASTFETVEQEHRNREEALQELECDLARREADLTEIAAREARVAEREDAFETTSAVLADRETELALRAAKLTEREQAFEKVCSMLTHMTTALQTPTPENLAAARVATEQASEVRPSPACIAQAAAKNDTTHESSSAPSARGASEISSSENGDVTPDLSDLTADELARMRMLRQVGTASVTEILAMIRGEREGAAPELPRKKRRWRF